MGHRQALLGDAQRTRGDRHSLYEPGKTAFFHCEGGQALTQGAQRGFGVYILGDVPNPSGHSPEHRLERTLGGQRGEMRGCPPV